MNAQMPMPGLTEDRRPTLVLVDGYALIFRAYHGMPATMTTSTGEPVGAVFGFTRMLLDVLRAHQPDYVLLTFDSGPTFRHAEFADYKANRPRMPDDLRQQVGRVREVVEALNIPIYEAPGYEADDVIGTMARQAAAQGLRAVILTGDRDLLQVVDANIEVLTPGARRFDEARLFDKREVERRYDFTPERLPDYKALVGDTSDNIPGVPGIGDKTARLLVAQFGALEEMLARVDEVQPARVQKALRENAEQAIQSKRLATIVTDLPVALEIERCRARDFDRAAVVRLFRDLEFRSLLAKVPEPLADATATPTDTTDAPAEVGHEVIRDLDGLRALVERLRGQPFALDTETGSLDVIQAELVGVSVAGSATLGSYIPLGHQEDGPQLTLADVQAVLGPLLADPAQPKLAHHAKYDLLVLERHGLPVQGLTFDTMLAAYLLGAASVGLKDLAFRELGREMTAIEDLIGRGKNQLSMAHVPIDQAAPYAAADATSTYALSGPLSAQLEARGLRRLLDEVELPLVPVLAAMERHGVRLDVPYMAEFSGQVEAQLRALEERVYELAGHAFNINSTQQLGTVLFDELGLKGGRRTQKGFSTASEVLEPLVGSHEIVRAVLNYRQLVKLKGTYIDSLPATVNPATGRVHTSYSQTTASTGRLASLNPNLQNIPIRTDLGRQVRRAFIADERPEWRLKGEPMRLVSVDYSQIELRILAHMSGDETLVTAFQEGQDIHTSTAAEIYGVAPEQVTADMRRLAKTVNFGVIYGLSAYGLARDTGLPQREAASFIEAYKSKFAPVFAYMERTKRSVSELGYAETLLGRRRYLPDINSGNGMVRAEAERMAINAPIQGTAADMMKLAMINIPPALREHGLESRLLLQVHDELLFEAPLSEVEAVATAARQVMVDAMPLSVPLGVEAKAGVNWEEMTPIDLRKH